MNKKLSYYELLGLIKDNRHTKKVEYNGNVYVWSFANYKSKSRRLNTSLDEINMFIPLITIIKEEILDEKEKEYLRAVIKPFRDKVDFILKKRASISEYIVIALKDEIIALPWFKKGTMYKGMETYKKYSLEDLNL